MRTSTFHIKPNKTIRLIIDFFRSYLFNLYSDIVSRKQEVHNSPQTFQELKNTKAVYDQVIGDPRFANNYTTFVSAEKSSCYVYCLMSHQDIEELILKKL